MKTIINTSNGYTQNLTVSELPEFMEDMKSPILAEKALKYLIANWRYHTVNSVNKANREKQDAMDKAHREGKTYTGAPLRPIKTDFRQWLMTREKVKVEVNDPIAERFWNRLIGKLGFDLDETTAEERGTDWAADVEIINEWVESANMGLAEEHQLPTLKTPFDEDGLPNEHPVSFDMLQRKTKASRK